MTRSRARLALAVTLFAGWLGFLGYLVAVSRDPVILSRPQFLVADWCVLADIAEANGLPARRVRVAEVLWPEDAQGWMGREVEVEGLDADETPAGWSGAGKYLLALTVRRDGDAERLQLTEVPPMPGFQPVATDRRVYRATPEALRQLEQLKP